MEQNYQNSLLISRIPQNIATFHACRVKNPVDGVIYQGNHPKISNLRGGDRGLFGPGVYTANEKSARNYLENRTKVHPKASLFEIDISNKKMFDLRFLLSLQSKQNGNSSKLSRLIKSDNPKVSQHGQNIKKELLGMTNDFIEFLNSQNNSSDWIICENIDRIISLNEIELYYSQELYSDPTLPYLIGAYKDDKFTEINEDALYLFGKFLATQGLDGLIGLESPDWHSDSNARERTYVIFDPKGEGIRGKKVE